MTELFPFTKTTRGRVVNGKRVFRLPIVEDLDEIQRKELVRFGPVSHLEWAQRSSFGRPCWVLLAWIVGCRQPIRWNKQMKTWLEDGR